MELRPRESRVAGFYKKLSNGLKNSSQTARLTNSQTIKLKHKAFISFLSRSLINSLKFKVKGPLIRQSKIVISKSLFLLLKNRGLRGSWSQQFNFLIDNCLPYIRYDSNGICVSIMDSSFHIKIMKKSPILYYDANRKISKTSEVFFFCYKFFPKLKV